MAKIVEVKEEKKTKKSNKIDLGKIKKLVDENPEAVSKIKEGVTDILASNILGKKTTKKSTTKKTAKKTTNSDSLSKVMDLAGTFLKK